ncbi:MAG: hypothetical protein VKL42_07345 [Snowella sp.]|nr:hypothetical protein [Snowella sp.]
MAQQVTFLWYHGHPAIALVWNRALDEERSDVLDSGDILLPNFRANQYW